MSLCLCPFSHLSLSPFFSLTCKWQKDSAMTFDTPRLCFLGGPDNCYGNRMSQRSVDLGCQSARWVLWSSLPLQICTCSVAVVTCMQIECLLRCCDESCNWRKKKRGYNVKSQQYSGDGYDNETDLDCSVGVLVCLCIDKEKVKQFIEQDCTRREERRERIRNTWMERNIEPLRVLGEV